MIKWAGRIIVFLGVGHTFLALLLTSPHYADEWFSGKLWDPQEGVVEMSSATAAFWLTTGSFGVPLVVIGLTVLWLDRRGIVPPLFIAWTLGAWSVVAAAILEPAPWMLAWVAVGLLLGGARRAARHAEPAPAAPATPSTSTSTSTQASASTPTSTPTSTSTSNELSEV
ncbi:DUF6463 family protein [Streptomyces sp. NPDC051907]|uniref:DUF6463 family protein n=1 Tax=Streptomyces sp. NPDC051907 TaxID=3155284 RepID=UPI003428F4EF